MVGKPTRGRRRLEMLEDLDENNSYEVLKSTAEDRSAWRDCTRKKVPKNLLYSRQIKKNVQHTLFWSELYVTLAV